MLYIIGSDYKDIKLYLLDPLYLQKWQQTFKIKPVNIQLRLSRMLIKRTPADMELSIYFKTYIYLYSYKTETAIFIATKHEKTITVVI